MITKAYASRTEYVEGYIKTKKGDLDYIRIDRVGCSPKYRVEGVCHPKGKPIEFKSKDRMFRHLGIQ